MPHPGDHGGLGPLLDRDAPRPGDRAAADGRGVLGDGTGQPVGQIGMLGVEGQERQDRPMEVNAKNPIDSCNGIQPGK